jgi:ADP-ribose pyrophosphatase YjhB (NUDIX family)
MRRFAGVRVLCVSEGQLLLVRHVDPASGGSYWVLPGGGCEAGETYAAAAVREVREETGIDVRVVRRLRVPSRAPHVTYALLLAAPVAHGEAAPTVDLARERYLRAAAWHRVGADRRLGPVNPAFWAYLAPRLRRLLRSTSGLTAPRESTGRPA